MEQLTVQECDILIEALDSWKASGMSKFLVGALLKSEMIDDKEEYNEEMTRDFDELKEEALGKEEIIILLKAKLIKIREEVKQTQIEELTQGEQK